LWFRRRMTVLHQEGERRMIGGNLKDSKGRERGGLKVTNGREWTPLMEKGV